MAFEEQAKTEINEVYTKLSADLVSVLETIPAPSFHEVEQALFSALVGKAFRFPNISDKAAFAKDILSEEVDTTRRINFFYDNRVNQTKILDVNFSTDRYYIKILNQGPTLVTTYFLIEFLDEIKRIITSKLQEKENYYKNVSSHLNSTLSKKELDTI